MQSENLQTAFGHIPDGFVLRNSCVSTSSNRNSEDLKYYKEEQTTTIMNQLQRRDLCRRKIIGHWKFLKEELTPKALVDLLISEELIKLKDWEKMKNLPRERQVDLTLTAIVRNIHGKQNFKSFVKVLKEDHEFIAAHLKTPYRGPIVPDRVSDIKVNRYKGILEHYKELLEDEIVASEIVDDFLERFAIKLNDHETVCKNYEENGAMIQSLLSIISLRLDMGSYECLLETLASNNNETNNALIEKLTTDVPIRAREPQKVRIEVRPKTTKMYPLNTGAIEVCTLTITVETTNSKHEVENLILATLDTEEPIECITAKFAMKRRSIKKSSVVVYLESVAGDVKLKIENSIMGGDMTTFLSQIFNSKAIKEHIRPGQYKIKTNLESTEKSKTDSNPFNLIKANRKLLENEFDPLPMIQDFRASQPKYSVENVSKKKALAFKKKFDKIDIESIPNRRKRVMRFLDVIEDELDTETFFEYLKIFGNAYLVHTLKKDMEPTNTHTPGLTVCNDVTKNGLVFEGEYDILVEQGVPPVTEREDATFTVKVILPEKTTKEKSYTISEDVKQPPKRRHASSLDPEIFENVTSWKKIRYETLPRLELLEKELRSANDKIKAARFFRNAALVTSFFGSLFYSPFTGGASLAFAVAVLGVTTGAALVLEMYIEKDVLDTTQEGINKDKEETIKLLTRITIYHGGHARTEEFIHDLRNISLEAINLLAERSLLSFLNELIDTNNQSLLRAIRKVNFYRYQLDRELRQVEEVEDRFNENKTG